MNWLLFLLFIALLAVGIIRIVTASISVGRFSRLSIKSGLAWLIAAAPIFVLWLSFQTVSAGTRAVVTRNGSVSRMLDPGAHLVIPFVENVNPISIQTQTVKPSEDAASFDLQVVHTEVTLAYHFDPAHIDYIFSQLSDASDNAVERKVIIPTILEAIKARTSQYTAQQLISERAAVRDGIESAVVSRLARYYIIPESVSITDFHFSKEFDNAIEAKVTAQQQAEKATNDLTRIKVEADQKVAAAEGEAKALKAQKEQITPELLQLRTIEMLTAKWDGALPQNYYGGTAPLPMMDVLKLTAKK